MGNSNSLPTLIGETIEKGRGFGKKATIAGDLIDIDRQDLAEQLILPLIKNASFDDICSLLSLKKIVKLGPLILAEYNPEEKQKLDIPKHLSALFRHLDLLDKVNLDDETLKSIFETVIEIQENELKNDKTDFMSSFVDLAVGTVLDKISSDQISKRMYELLGRVPAEQLTRVEDETSISRFDLCPKTLSIVELKRYRDLAPLSTIAQSHWKRIERKHSPRLLTEVAEVAETIVSDKFLRCKFPNSDQKDLH